MAFYAQARTLGTSGIVALCKRQVTTTQEKEWGWAEGGAYKPLNVWANLGHDAESIKAKAQPEDIRVHPTYGWDEYRVRELRTEKGNKTKVSNKLEILGKTRTRALKRKGTEESVKSKRSKRSDPSTSFSSESSASSDEEPAAAKPKGKAKGKAKASSAKREQAAVKAKAKTAAAKLKTTKDGLKKAIAHPEIFDVSEEVVHPVKQFLRMLSTVEEHVADSIKTGVDTFGEQFSAIDFKNIKSAKDALEKALKDKSKPAKKGKKGLLERVQARGGVPEGQEE